MLKKMKRFYSWLRLFPQVVLTDKRSTGYLNNVTKTMNQYDMLSASAEDYYKLRYLNIIIPVIREHFSDKSLRILDAGCGQGRLAIELAKRGHTIEAVDYVESVLSKGREYAKKFNVEKKINWTKGKLPEALSSFEGNNYDVILCLEMLYMMSAEDSQKTLEGLARLTKKGGILAVSMRSRFFYLAYALMNRDFVKLEWCAKNKDFTGLGNWTSWIDTEEMWDFFKRNNFRNITIRGIGVLSGIEKDPTSLFCFPYLLSEGQKRLLGEIEDRYGEVYPDTGRYVVFVGEKY